MAKIKDWREQLTPFDSELFMMVESLTQRECVPEFDGDGYRFLADYELHQKEPNWILAVWDAIEGRTGERLLEIEDVPECHCLSVKVKFSEQEYPNITRLDRDSPENPEAGDVYCKSMEEIRAVKVTKANAGKLLAFIGNGEMEIEPKPKGKATFHFLNANGSVYAHAPESSYVVYAKPGHFLIFSKSEFESLYEKK